MERYTNQLDARLSAGRLAREFGEPMRVVSYGGACSFSVTNADCTLAEIRRYFGSDALIVETINSKGA